MERSKLKKPASFFIVMVLASQLLLAQGTLKITHGSYLKVAGATQMVLQNTSLENNGFFSADSGTVYFTGTGNDSIKGTNPTTFYKVVVNKTGSGDLAQAQDIQVEDTLRFVSGNHNLNGHDLTLGSSAGVLAGESESSRIVGPNGGEVVKVTSLNAPNAANPGNLGASLTSSANLQTVILKRGHVAQTLPGGDAIERYYEIIPTNNQNLNATINLTYFDAELNGLTEANLESWYFDGTNWVNLSPDMTDGGANYVEFTADELGKMTLAEGAIKIRLRAFLQGSYSGGVMADNLRNNNLIPTTEPYDAMGFTHVGGGGETISPSVLSITGNDAIVDWIFLELRDKNDSTIILRTQSALLQADGDIVGLDGTSAVTFPGLAQDDYYLFLRHRNHLGVRSPGLMSLAAMETYHDFSSGLGQAWDNPIISTNNAMVDLGGGVYGLYRGDVNTDGRINVVDFLIAKNSSSPNQSGVYNVNDINMDGNINVVDFLISKAQSSPNKTAHQ